MSKFYNRPYFYIPAALVLLVIIFIAILLWPNGKTPASIHSITGDVTVDEGNGFVAANVDQELSENDVIKTGPSSEAIVVLYEKVIVTVKENSQITISQLSSKNQALTQQTGTVWTKVAKLGGKEEFSITTPTTTATVRGTIFMTRDGQMYELLVGEGVVEAGGVMVYRLEKLVGTNGEYAKVNLTDDEKRELANEIEKEIIVLQDLRLGAVLKNDIAMSFVRSNYGVTDAQVAQFLLDIDSGKESEDTVRNNAPVDTQGLEEFYAYNKEIKDMMQLVKTLRGE